MGGSCAGARKQPNAATLSGVDGTSTVLLIERARNGDTSALDELFRRCLPPLRRWATGRLPRALRDGADTEDLLQDTLIRTLARLQSVEWDGQGALQAYLRQAILNRIRDEIRRVRRRPPGERLTDGYETADASPLEEAIGAQALGRYEAALERLDPTEREAIIARVELGYSYQDVAIATGRPSAEAARLAVRRALVRLAEKMEELDRR